MSWTNTSKNSVSWANGTKSAAAAFVGVGKSGLAWTYNDLSITYSGATDINIGDPIYYNGLGTAPTYTNVSKS